MRRLISTLRLFTIGVLIIAAIGITIPLMMRMKTLTRTFVALSDVPKSEVAIILGASVANRKPSPVLASRADAAIALYQTGKVQIILVTGDSALLTHDEVTPVRDYLVRAGIPAERIMLDPSGFDTYSSMYRAHEAFGDKPVIIVTQDFHLPRAIFIARELGMQAYGFVATADSPSPYDYVREIPASDKALWDLITRREPR